MKIDQMFTQNPELLGDKPSPLVLGLMRYLSPNDLVLDVGAGQGWNAVPLAHAGFFM
jgi:2-polyprenyl-3-methyl-5-hydroxy-6-metoxy-1,4-benzoquinol methylase